MLYVLLILAGISISMLSGNNGILQKATDAKEKTGTSQIDERVYLAVNSAIANGLGTLNYDNLNSELEREFGQGNYTITPSNDAESWQVKVTASGITKNYTIKSTGEVKVASGGDDEPTGTLQLSFNEVPTESRAVILEATLKIPTKADLQAKSEEELRPYVLRVYYNITKSEATWSDIQSMLGSEEITVHQVFLAVKSQLSSMTGNTYEDEYDLIIKEEGYLEVATFTCNGETVTGTKGEFLITNNGSYTVTASKGEETGSVTANVTNCVNRTDNQVETFEYPTNRNQNYTLSQNGYEVVIPAGFAYGKSSNVGTVATGLVITDDIDEKGNSTGNEFVWIPIDKDNLTVGKTGQKPMAEVGTTSGTDCREPAYLSDERYGDASSFNDGVIGTDTLQNEYNAMIRSVKQYGGFYIARYEMGKGTDYSKLGVTPTSADASDENMWYGLYKKAKSYNKSGVTSGMIWGSQYDAMLNFGLTNSADSGKVNAKTNGNHGGSKLKTGTYKGSDSINNIFDLEGNLSEWTKEAVHTAYRVARGDGYGSTNHSPSYRWGIDPGDGYTPNDLFRVGGTRLTLYIDLNSSSDTNNYRGILYTSW